MAAMQKNFVTVVTPLGLKTGGKVVPWRGRQRGRLDVGSAAEFSDFNVEVVRAEF
jgi:hypothetical protein